MWLGRALWGHWEREGGGGEDGCQAWGSGRGAVGRAPPLGVVWG